jgi:tetratricopeptide (TPR) repeat protein
MQKPTFLFLVCTAYSVCTLAQNADSAAFYQQKGVTEQQARRFREAEKNFAKADQFLPGQSPTLIEWGNALTAQNRYAEARDKFLKAELKDPNNPVVIENLATLSLNVRNWPDAVKYAQKVQQLNPSRPMSFIIAKCYYEQDNYGQALKYCEKAYREDSTKAEVPYIAARCFLEMSNYKRAEGCYQQAIARDSNNTKWIYEAGLAAYAIPDDKKALYWFEKANDKGIKRTNDYIENLANVYLNLNQWDKGLPLLKELLDHKPGDQELIYNVADAYYRSGKYQEAIDHWDMILGIDKKNANALYMIGLAYQKKGDKQKGEQLCNQAIAMDPNLKSLRQERKMPGGM